MAALPDEYQLEWLLPYAPELSPKGPCNGTVKGELLSIVPAAVAALHRQARRAFLRLSRRSRHLHGLFTQADLSVAAFNTGHSCLGQLPAGGAVQRGG